MVFNSLNQTITKSDEFKQINYVYHKILKAINWFQFADNAVAITSNEYENQILLNVFSRWCRWSNMIIRTDKCSSFEIYKWGSKSVQFKLACVQALQSVRRSEKEKKAPCRVCATATNSVFEFSDYVEPSVIGCTI